MFRPLRNVLWFVVIFLSQQAVSFGYFFNGYTWPTATQITMDLQLVRNAVPLQDGSASWNASAADALATWNQYISKVHFVEGSPGPASGGDGVNAVFFANDIYGETWSTTTLAVTLYYSQSGNRVFSETDVIFNNLRRWNSYRGPQQGSGSTATYDLHRVALHEFGHALGLDHPDEHGQSVNAIMNSIISNLDQLADDDIAGATALYGFKITSSQSTQYTRSGDPFSYQIRADNSPTTFSASGLPPGLQVDSATGLISGRCSVSGTFTINLVVQGALGTAIGKFQLIVSALPLTNTNTTQQVLIGNNLVFQVTASNNPTSFTATGLPAGFSIDSQTGIISGVATTTGSYFVSIVAQGATSQATGAIYIEILPPQITSPTNLAPLELGDSFTYQITASHSATSFGATNLPPSFQFDSRTGLITGTATQAGSFYSTISAVTSYGTASNSLGINILAPHITSASNPVGVLIGGTFGYQITASNRPTSFSATGLPAGLVIDPTSGFISGTPTLSGQFQVRVTARGTVGDASGSFTLTVITGWTYTPDKSEIAFPQNQTVLSVIADPVRPRLYVGTQSGITIVNSLSYATEVSLPISGGATDLEISADGKRLYAVGYLSVIKCLDLTTLGFLRDISASGHTPASVREGGDGYFYITDVSQRQSVFQIDPATGATLNQITPIERNNSTQLQIKFSPDRRTMFIGEIHRISPVLAKYSLAPGSAPTLLQRIDIGDSNSAIQRFALTPDGQSVAWAITTRNSVPPAPTVLRSTADLTVSLGTFDAPLGTDQIIFSPDGTVAVQTYFSSSRIDIFEMPARRLVRTITLPDRAIPGTTSSSPDLAVDWQNESLFIVARANSISKVYIYPLRSPVPRPKSLLNVSTRLRAQSGDDVLIGGFIITGTEPKKVIVRAIGPSLPVTGKLADPTLELHASDGSLLAANDNWNEHRIDVLDSTVPPNDEHESAIVATLSPGAYTAVMNGVANSTGVALVELYDLSPASSSRIANISTRGKVETGDNVMIGGFIIGGDQATKVIVRAIGPSLGSRGVAGTLSDTTLDLYDGNGSKFASNDDWQSDQAQEIINSTVQPSDPRESALVRTLQPGSYTAIVRGKNESTGVALVEVYNLETN